MIIKCYSSTGFVIYEGKYIPNGKVLGVQQSGGIWLYANCTDGIDLNEDYPKKDRFWWFTLKDLRNNGGDIA